MNTRIERIGNKEYCAYCGKVLRDYGLPYTIHPEPPLICNCEKAKYELELQKKLAELYRSPIAESLIDIKVEKYRQSLTGKTEAAIVPV